MALQALITVALLVLLVRSLDLRAFRELFVRLPLWFYLLSFLVILSGQVAYAWRWRLLLVAAGVRVPFTLVLRQYFIGIFVNNFLPSTVGGDVAKVYYLGRSHGYRVVTASIVMDRVLGIGLLALLAAVTLWAKPVSTAVLTASHLLVAGVAAAALAVLALTTFGTGGLPARVAPFGSTAVALASRLQRLRLDMAAPLTNASVVLKAGTVVAGYFVAVTAVYVGFVTLQGSEPPAFIVMFAIVTATSVLSNIPVSLNGLGLREQLHATLLAPLGVAPEVAVAISLLLFAHVVLASMAGLVFWLQVPVVSREVPEQPRDWGLGTGG